jgi:hypothetical protein
MKYPQILTEIHLVEKFLPRNVRKSARAMYLEMIGAACSYLLDLEVDQPLQLLDSVYTLEDGAVRHNQTIA